MLLEIYYKCSTAKMTVKIEYIYSFFHLSALLNSNIFDVLFTTVYLNKLLISLLNYVFKENHQNLKKKQKTAFLQAATW